MPEEIMIQTYLLDDDRVLLDNMDELFQQSGIENYKLFHNQDEFLSEFNPNVKICIIDYYLDKGVKGLDVMKKVLEVCPKCRIIVISAIKTLDAVIDCNNLGPFPFLNKLAENFDEQLVMFVKKSIQMVKAERELYNLIMHS